MNPELQVDVKLNDADYQRGVQRIQGSMQTMSTNFRAVGRDISQISREFTLIGGTISASMTLAFSKASKDLPVVNAQLKQVSNSFQALADNVALAAMPSLVEFTKFANNLSVAVSNLAKNHSELFNQIIKWGGYTLVLAGVGNSIATLSRAIGGITDLLRRFGISVTLSNVELATLAGTAFSLYAVFTILEDKTISLAAKLKAFSVSGAFGFGSLFAQTGSGQKAMANWHDLLNAWKKFQEDMQGKNNETVKTVSDHWGKFVEGFKSDIKTLNENISAFGLGVSKSFEKGFSDTIFNSITGKFNSLRDVVVGLGNDIAHAFSQFAASEIMAALIGRAADGKAGFGGIAGALFGGGGKTSSHDSGAGSISVAGYGNHYMTAAQTAQQNHLNMGMRKNTKEFDALTENMKKFAKAKDNVIDNFKLFDKTLVNSSNMLTSAFVGLGSTSKAVGMYEVQFASQLGTAWAGMTNGIGVGFMQVISNLEQASEAILQMLSSGGGKGSAWGGLWNTIKGIVGFKPEGGWSFGSIFSNLGNRVANLASSYGVQGTYAAAQSSSSSGGENNPSGDNSSISMGSGAEAVGARGGIVRRPTMALIGEAGPEALIPLDQTSGNSPLGKMRGSSGGDTNVTISIDTAMLNSPSNMRDFVKILKEELAR